MLLATVTTHVIRHTFRTHVFAYCAAYRRERRPEQKNIAMSLSRDALVEWYASKLKISFKYDSPAAVLRITKLQKMVRGWLGKKNFQKVLSELANDPKMIHNKTMDALHNLEAHVMGIKGEIGSSPARELAPANRQSSAHGWDSAALTQLQAQLQTASEMVIKFDKQVKDSNAEDEMCSVWKGHLQVQVDLMASLSQRIKSVQDTISSASNVLPALAQT